MRVVAGFVLFLLSVTSIMAGGLVFPAAFGLACVYGGNEFIKMVQAKGVRPSVRIVRGMIIAFFVLAALPQVPVIGEQLMSRLGAGFPLDHFPFLLTVGIFISFFRLLLRSQRLRSDQPPATIADIASTILGFIYVGWMPAHMVLLRNLSDPNVPPESPLQQPGLAYVWVSLFIIWATDIFAYYCGKKWGKHKLYEEISPKKTIQGAIGGLVAAIFWAWLVVWVADTFLFPTHPFRGKIWIAPFMGFFVSVAAQLGDLCESLLKRDAGLKDSGDAIPGHGGVLDRGDSILFGAPISYYWIKIFFLGIL